LDAKIPPQGVTIARDFARIVAQFGDPIEFTGDTQAGERRVHDQTEAFPREVIDQRQDAEAPAAH